MKWEEIVMGIKKVKSSEMEKIELLNEEIEGKMWGGNKIKVWWERGKGRLKMRKGWNDGMKKIVMKEIKID